MRNAKQCKERRGKVSIQKKITQRQLIKVSSFDWKSHSYAKMSMLCMCAEIEIYMYVHVI